MVTNAAFARFEDNPARQLAYQLWAADPSRPISELLPELRAELGENVATRTVYDWRERDHWEKRLAEEVLAASGVSVFEQVRRLRVAALPAIRYIDSVARGEVKPDRLRMEAAKFLVQQSAAVHQLAAGKLPDAGAQAISASELLALEPPYHPEE
jgi:hypothetical protein